VICNENIGASVVQSLRDHGHDVLAVKESLRGAADDTILARAQAESRVVVTQDKDFGELAFRRGLPAQAGVILFRITIANPDIDRRRLVAVIESRPDWSGLFAVVTDDRIRIRPVPPVS
jgi:predicted nuclease of predicted toxin-antitoxin system